MRSGYSLPRAPCHTDPIWSGNLIKMLTHKGPYFRYLSQNLPFTSLLCTTKVHSRVILLKPKASVGRCFFKINAKSVSVWQFLFFCHLPRVFPYQIQWCTTQTNLIFLAENCPVKRLIRDVNVVWTVGFIHVTVC